MNWTNSTTGSTDNTEDVVLYAATFVFWPLICAWIAVVNIFVTIVTFTNQQLRMDPHCVIISGLSISDGAVGLFGLGLVASVTTGGIKLEFLCIAVYLCVYAVYFVSCLQILLVCVERIVSVKYPLHLKRWFSVRHNIAYVFLIWVFAFTVFSVPFLLWYKTGKTDICIVHEMFEPRLGLHYFVSAGGLLTYIAIMIAYFILIYEFRLLNRRRPMHEQQCQDKTNQETTFLARSRQAGVSDGSTGCQLTGFHENQMAETETSENVTTSNAPAEVKGIRNRIIVFFATAGQSKELKTASNKLPRSSTREAMRVLTVIIIALTFTVPVGALAGIIPRLIKSKEWDSSMDGRRLRLLLVYISLLNSGINPLIYAFGMRKFRAALEDIYKKLRGKCKCKTRSGSTGRCSPSHGSV